MTIIDLEAMDDETRDALLPLLARVHAGETLAVVNPSTGAVLVMSAAVHPAILRSVTERTPFD